MLGWALLFLIIALVAGALGLGALQGIAQTIAWVLAIVFLILFVVGLFAGRSRPVA